MDKNLHDLTHSVAESLGDIVYNVGWKDGWESAKTVCNIWANTTDKECEEMFGFSNIFNIFNNFSASEIEEKFKTWETEHKNIYSKCNTCTHKNEDVICYDCVNGSEYEEEPKLTEKRCIECKHHSDAHDYCLLEIVGVRCVNRDHWKPKQTEKQPKQSCEDCINENTCSLKCPEHVKANGCRSWAPKQTNDKIKLGDEVITRTGGRGIVIGIGSENFYLLMHDYDVPQKVSKEGYTRTGRYFPQIEELRDQLL